MNNMSCNLETGICGTAEDSSTDIIDFNQQVKKATLYYFTDPICSHCWALEPVLNRFIEQYGQYFRTSIVMGGLLQSWRGFSDRSNGIQKPSDVAEHWKEVGIHSRMPIDGSLWHNNPIQSSYPASRVFKIIQANHGMKSHDYLRKAREAVFVFNKNIGEDHVLIEIVNQIGLDGEQIVEQAGTEYAQQLLDMDFDQAKRFEATGFPTVVLVNEENQGLKVVGAQALQAYVTALSKILHAQLVPVNVPALHDWLEKENRPIFSKEIEVMYDLQKEAVLPFVQQSLPDNAYRVQEILGEVYFESN